MASRRFIDAGVVAAFKAAVSQIDRDTAAEPRRAAAQLGAAIGLPELVIAEALARQGWAVAPVDASVVADQQAIADRFLHLGLIPKAIRVADAVPAAPS